MCVCVCGGGGGGYIHVRVTGGWMIKYTAMHSQMDSMCKRKGREKEGGRREKERERHKARKMKYHDLVEVGRAVGYKAELITMEVGSRGMLGDSDLDALREAIDAPRKKFTGVCILAIRTATLGGFGTWCSRNCIT